VYKTDPDTALRVIARYTKTDNIESLRPAAAEQHPGAGL
jgi:hypothetical protein